MDNQLIIGIILIVVGIALALLAYAFILNRRDQGKEPEEGTPAAEVEPEEAEASQEAAPVAGTPPPWMKPPAEVAAAPPAEPEPALPIAPSSVSPPPPSTVPVPPDAAPVVAPAPSTAPIPPDAAPVAAPTPVPPPSRRTLAVATLLRDEVTGKLLVLVGGREYATVDELRASKDYARVEYAAADLMQWLGPAAVRERAVERASKEEAKKPATMVEQINEILQQKLVAASGTSRGVRLVEGVGGALRVYIGVHSYSFEDVPDEDVKGMIREAVAEWEAKK